MSKFTYEYPRPALGTDMLLFSKQPDNVYILLIQRKNTPFKDFWAFPGGFVEEGESCEQAVLRELKEETGLEHSNLFQIGAFSDPERDPRGWIVTVAFAAWVNMKETKPIAGDDAKNVKWFSLDKMPPLAFDHAIILNKAISVFVDANTRS